MADLLSRVRDALADKYSVEGVLGQGGMATVYLADDLKHSRKVAVKVLSPDIAKSMGGERFHREIQIASRLTHPHILPVFDSGEADGLLYYVMPYVEGESLRGRMNREQQLPLDDALRITCEVGSALSHAHSYGVIHRDIKPENILLQGNHAVVADFGIARAVDAAGGKLTETGMTVGTPHYMAPEQSAGDAVDGRSDLYSLACVLYEMLIGQPPFTGPNAMAIMARHSMEAVPSLQVVRQTIPDELEDTIMQALQKVPADRFTTVSQFTDALQACSHEITTPKRLTQRTTRSTRSARQQRTASRKGLIALAIGLPIAAALAWGGWRYSQAGRRTAATGTGLDARHVAVMYFRDDSRGGELRHVADGLTESLIGELSRVQVLDVVSPNGVAQFRDGEAEPDSVARALKVGTIVQGSVKETGASSDSVRVDIRMFDASGAEFARSGIRAARNDVIVARDSLAAEVAAMLRERIGDEVSRVRARTEGTQNSDAWTFFQRAERQRKDAEAIVRSNQADAVAGLRAADSLLALASQADPQWTEPLAERARIAVRLARLPSQRAQARRWIDSGLVHAERALAINPRDAGALEQRGTLRFTMYKLHLVAEKAGQEALLRSAEEDLKAAVQNDEDRATAWYTLSQFHYEKPDVLEANLAAQNAYEADAYLTAAPAILWRLWATSYDLQQWGKATDWCRTGHRRFPQRAEFVLCDLYMYIPKATTADIPEAWRLLSEYEARLSDAEKPVQSRLGRILVAAAIGNAGLKDSARRVLDGAMADASVDPERELLGYQAIVRARIGDRDDAITLLKEYLTANPTHRSGLRKYNGWWWKDLEGDPRFRELTGSSG